jgi:hypothetical protein
MHATTSALSEVSRCAAATRALRYTSSGTETVIFFTVSQFHSKTVFVARAPRRAPGMPRTGKFASGELAQ